MKMIGMRMGQQHGVEPGGAGVEQLLAQIGRGIDQERGTAAFDEERAAAPIVARLGGGARPPIPADRPDAPGRAATKEGRLHSAFLPGTQAGSPCRKDRGNYRSSPPRGAP